MATSAPLARVLTSRRGAIFAALKANGLDDAARRQIVKTLTGRDSMKDCTVNELGEILNHLNRGKQGYLGRRRSTPSADRAPLLAKITALLAELHRVTGQVHTLKYADAICKRNGWAECVDFADAAALKNVVGALNRTLQYRMAGH